MVLRAPRVPAATAEGGVIREVGDAGDSPRGRAAEQKPPSHQVGR